VAEGNSLADGLRDAGVFPSFMVSRIAVAEKGGDLPAAFLELGRYYDQLVDLRSRVFTSMVEPLLLIIVGGCILAVIVSLFLPLLAIISELSS
jgi:type II secretory pathway component PulF